MGFLYTQHTGQHAITGRHYSEYLPAANSQLLVGMAAPDF